MNFPDYYWSLGIYQNLPVVPELVLREERLATFANSPHANKEQFAEAGFYYTGCSDGARCFHCGRGLQCWEPQNEPWIEHARYFPHCAFLLLSKGKEFVDIVQERRTELVTTWMVIQELAKRREETWSIKNDDVTIHQDLDQLRNELQCVVCMDKEKTVVFMRCRHFVTCAECALSLKHCPVCRATIECLTSAYLTSKRKKRVRSKTI